MEALQNIDFSILNFFQSYIRCGVLDIIMPFITTLGNGGAIWIIIALSLAVTKKYRKLGLTMGLALVFSLLIGNIILKPSIARVRPFNINTSIQLLITAPVDFSFPSGHAMSSFAAATVIFCYNKRYGIGALILAGLIAFSRLYLYVHFPSDVIIGTIIGILLALAAVKIMNKFSSLN